MTYLSKLSVEHFRGVLDRQEISFSLPNKEAGSGLTILVGPNNVGKSTIIEALRCAVSPPYLMDRRERHIDQALRISITDTDNKFREITNLGMGANITPSGNAYPSARQLRYIPSRRPWSHRANGHNMELGDYWIQRASNSRSEDSNLIARLNSFPPEEKVAYQGALKQLAPQLMDWNIEYSDGFTYLEYTTINGSTHTADLFGEGIASLFRIVLALYDPEESIVIIDEPELSLHPQAQKRLAKFLSEKAKERQIVLCTHSPHFLNWKDLAAGAVVYRLRQDRNGIQLNHLSKETIISLSKLSDDWQKPQLLDAVAKEIFFADEVVFLEGQEDVSLIGRFIESENIAPIQLFGYGVGGSKNTVRFLAMATELKIPCGAIFDGTSKEDYEEASARYTNAEVELLPTPDIRDKPPTAGKSAVQGIFDKNGQIKNEFREYLLAILRELREYFDERLRP
jgi:predicted ATP-dependent endonuclease of OLD family